jgi:hypothetical protein
MLTGEWPKGDIDHINRVKSDNRLCNLREATRSQNNANSNLRKDNRYGVRGITWMPKRKKWKARLAYKGITKNLGHFDRKEDAILAYQQCAKLTFGEFVP